MKIACRVRSHLQAVVLVALSVATVARAADDGVGIVAEYRPAAARFTFERSPDATPVAVRIGTVVMAGDRITLPEGASVTIVLTEGKSSHFGGPGTYTVAPSSPLGKTSKFFAALWSVFDDEYRLEGTAASRGPGGCANGEAPEPIDVPIIAPGAYIVAGERDLPLAWRGGCSPFAVAVFKDDRLVARRDAIDGRQVRLENVPMPEGRYAVRVEDATGLRFTADVESVAAVPALPPEIAAGNTSLEVIAQAVWLAQVDGSRWRFDSFERLRPLIRAGDPLAGKIGDGVLWAALPEADTVGAQADRVHETPPTP